MSRFDFVGSAALGQYLARDGWFQRRDPRAKLFFFGFLFAALVITARLGAVSAGLGVILMVYAVARLPLLPAWRTIRRSLIFMLILVILQVVLFRPEPDSQITVAILGLTIYRDALMIAAVLILKLISFILLINALVMTISTAQITTALFHLLKPLEVLHFPVNALTMAVQVTLRYLPIVAQIAENTAKAQAARGADWDQQGFNPLKQARRMLPLFIPILLGSLRRAETMAVAMESRGFNAADQRSSFYRLTFSWQDVVLILMSVGLAVLLILVGRSF